MLSAASEILVFSMQVRDIIEAREKARGGAVGGAVSSQQAGSKGQLRHVSIQVHAWNFFIFHRCRLFVEVFSISPTDKLID